MTTRLSSLFLVAVVIVGSCRRSPIETQAQYELEYLADEKLVEIVFLDDKDAWDGGGELVAVAPPIRDRKNIADFVAATKLDLPPKPGTEHLAGVVCVIAFIGEKGEIIASSTLYSADAVLGRSGVKFSPSKKIFIRADAESSRDRLLPRKAPHFGEYVISYLRQHNPKRYEGEWLIDLERKESQAPNQKGSRKGSGAENR